MSSDELNSRFDIRHLELQPFMLCVPFEYLFYVVFLKAVQERLGDEVLDRRLVPGIKIKNLRDHPLADVSRQHPFDRRSNQMEGIRVLPHEPGDAASGG